MDSKNIKKKNRWLYKTYEAKSQNMEDKNIMKNRIVKNQKEIEKYRNKIFQTKEESRQVFAREPFEKKLKIAFQLYERTKYLKKFKAGI